MRMVRITRGLVLVCGFGALAVSPALANHPVLVEGNNAANGPAGTTMVQPGTAGDYDGDGLVGTAEDNDNTTDRVFGTITAALLAANGGANANGHVIIVTSGRFNEAIRIPNVAAGQAAINGVTIIEAAPGVQANIDAVVAGSAGNADRQAGPGIFINTDQTDRSVILRNLVVRNFTVGLQIMGRSRVTVERCRFDSNVNHNVLVGDQARLTMAHCSVNAGGMRFNPAKATPNPGNGITVVGWASAMICHTTISGNTGAGIARMTRGTVKQKDNCLFDNDPDFAGMGLNDRD